MNRIQTLLDDLGAPGALDSAASQAAAGVGKLVAADPESIALFCPLHYEPNYAYPLLVWLHGPEQSERQVQRIMPLVSMRNYVGVGVRGTASVVTQGVLRGYDWSQQESHIAQAEERVLAAVDAAEQRYHISPTRIFLAGFDGGGTSALRIACAHPDRFAGAISFCGEFPQGYAPLARLHEARRLALLLATGRDSRLYPPEKVCENLRLFFAAGMSINLRQYPVGHELARQMLSDLDRWIMEQITAPASAGAQCSS
jgi:phospholipase/carboxylesterase